MMIEELASEIATRILAQLGPTAARPVYSSRDLQDLLGFGRDEARAIIRTHGRLRRVTARNLERYSLGLPAQWDR